jgi:hypothetical protein
MAAACNCGFSRRVRSSGIWLVVSAAQTRDRFISGHRIERSTRETGRGQEAVDLGFRSEPTKAARKVDLGKSEGRYLRGHYRVRGCVGRAAFSIPRVRKMIRSAALAWELPDNFARQGVCDVLGAIGCRNNQPPRIRTEGDTDHARAHSYDSIQETGLRRPGTRCAVVTPRNEKGAVGAECHATHYACVPHQNQYGIQGRSVPNCDPACYCSGRHGQPVRTKCCRTDGSFFFGNRSNVLPRDEIDDSKAPCYVDGQEATTVRADDRRRSQAGQCGRFERLFCSLSLRISSSSFLFGSHAGSVREVPRLIRLQVEN